MAKQTVIDWGRESVVAAVCSQRGSNFSIEKISYQKYGGEGEHPSSAAALKAAIDEVGAKGPAIVLASRELVEVRTISIPQMDPAELPDVIRFQAQRQFANMGDSWPIDFVLLPAHSAGEMVTALVGVISLQEMQSIEKACESASIQPSHVGMRPLEIARYGTASGQLPQSGSSLLISVSEQVADLMLLNEGRVVQIRGMKLPTDAAQTPAVVKGELRRSLMAASKHLPTGKFDSVMLLADTEHAALLEPIVADATGASVATTDPTNLLASGLTIDDLPASGPRLAAVAGAVALPSADKATVLDFKNPKKRPPKKSNRNTFILAGAAVALLALGGISWWYWTNADLDDQLTALLADKENKEQQQESAEKRSEEFAEVEQFLAQSPNWLDELTYISSKIPPADKVQIAGVQFLTGVRGQAQVQINSVVADSAESLDAFEESLRDDNHDVSSKNRQQLRESIGKYEWAASPTIVELLDRGWNMDGKIEELMRLQRENSSSKKDAQEPKQDAAEEDGDSGQEESAEQASSPEQADSKPMADDDASSEDQPESSADGPASSDSEGSGDESDGDESGGDESGGDESDGDESDGDESGGDESGGDESVGDESGGKESSESEETSGGSSDETDVKPESEKKPPKIASAK